MINLKSYKDGDRLILVVENCTGETAVKVNEFITNLLGIAPVEPVPVPHVQPIAVKEDPAPDTSQMQVLESPAFEEPAKKEEVEGMTLTGGPYQGFTPYEALLQDGARAAAMLIATSNISIQSRDRDELIVICKERIRLDLIQRQMELFSKESFLELVDTYRPLLADGLEQILNQTGFRDLDSFVEYSSEKTVEDAKESLIEGLMEYC